MTFGLLATNGSFIDAAASSAAASMEQRPVLALVVRDLVGIDAVSRAVAKAQAIRIMQHTEIELHWIDANGTEDVSLAVSLNNYFTIVITSEPPAGWTKPDAMGFAPARSGPHPRAYVFTGRVRAFLGRFNAQNTSSFGIILGHAMVHELGHLLVDGDAHGSGIMRANWAYREWQQALEGTLLFASPQAKFLRERVW